MNLNETQSAAVCKAFCTMQELEDAAANIGVKIVCIIDSNGDFFCAPDDKNYIPHEGLACFLRSVKDRTAKEIEDFKTDWIQVLRDGKEKLRQDRIEQLKAELAELGYPEEPSQGHLV